MTDGRTNERTKRRLVGEDFSEFLSPCPTLSRRATSVQRNGIYVSISRGRASLFDSKRRKETEEEERKKARLLSFRFHSRVKATSKNPRVLSQEARRRERESLLALEQRGKEVSPEREGIKRKEEYFTCTVVTHPERNCFKRIVSRERENLLGSFF